LVVQILVFFLVPAKKTKMVFFGSQLKVEKTSTNVFPDNTFNNFSQERFLTFSSPLVFSFGPKKKRTLACGEIYFSCSNFCSFFC
jgi:hypothetical protein